MAKFYRVEHSTERLGPYRFKYGLLDGSISIQRPAPYDEFGPEYDCFGTKIHTKVFGFTSIEQALHWFYDELEALHKAGFVLRVFEVPDSELVTKPYATQAMLNKDWYSMIKPIEEIPI